MGGHVAVTVLVDLANHVRDLKHSVVADEALKEVLGADRFQHLLGPHELARETGRVLSYVLALFVDVDLIIHLLLESYETLLKNHSDVDSVFKVGLPARKREPNLVLVSFGELDRVLSQYSHEILQQNHIRVIFVT